MGEKDAALSQVRGAASGAALAYYSRSARRAGQRGDAGGQLLRPLLARRRHEPVAWGRGDGRRCHATCVPCVRTELCTEVLPQCTHLGHCPLPQGAQAGMGADAQYGCGYGTIHGSAQVIACSVACPSVHTCNVVVCWQTRLAIACSELCPTHLTCNYDCYITRNPAVCPIASAIGCPPQSLGCPQQSLGCGGQGPAPFAGAGSFFGNHSCPGVCRPMTVECLQ